MPMDFGMSSFCLVPSFILLAKKQEENYTKNS